MTGALPTRLLDERTNSGILLTQDRQSKQHEQLSAREDCMWTTSLQTAAVVGALSQQHASEAIEV